MDTLLRNVSFILEKVDIPNIFQNFLVKLKIETYDWIELGYYVNSDLPIGIDFPILLNSGWFRNPNIELQIGISSDIYEGILEIQKEKENPEIFYARGIATVFNSKTHYAPLTLQCAIFVQEIGKRSDTVDKNTQTKGIRNSEAECQTEHQEEYRSIGTNTEGSSVKMSDIISVVETSVARKLKEIKGSRQPIQIDVEDPKPSDVERKLPPMQSYNLVPRLTKLRKLDAMIAEKTSLLKDLEVELEMRRKMRIIMERREELEGIARETSSSESASNSRSEETSTSEEERSIEDPFSS